MALHHFRRFEKYIIWIVAIFVIPIFAFTFGMGGGNNKTKTIPVLKIDGRTVNDAEIIMLMNRVSFLYNMRFPRNKEGFERAGIFILQIEDARKAGLAASNAEINTFRRNKFSKYVDKKTGVFDWERYREFLKDYNITPAEIHKAMEEALLLEKFDLVIDNSSIASPYESYLLWAQENSEIACDVVSFKTEDYIATAREAIPDLDAEIQAYLDRNANNPSFIQSGTWRLEYILSRFDSWKPQQITDKDIKGYFKATAEEFKDKKLEDVREEITEALARESRRLQAQRQLHQVEKNLSHFGEDDLPVLASKIIAGDVSLQRASKEKKLESGSTGDTLLSFKLLEQNPEIGNCPALINQLKKLDSPASFKPNTPPEEMLTRLKQTFNTAQDNFTTGEDFSNEDCVFKIRIVEYRPGEIRDPKVDKDFRKELEDLLLNEKAALLAITAAEAQSQRVRAGDNEGIEFQSRTMKLPEAERSNRELTNSRLAPGDSTDVKEVYGGFEFTVLRGRAVPPYSAFEMLPEEKRVEFRKKATQLSRRQWSYDYRTGRSNPAPGDRQRMWTMDARQNRIEHLYDWERAGN